MRHPTLPLLLLFPLSACTTAPLLQFTQTWEASGQRIARVGTPPEVTTAGSASDAIEG